MMGSTGALKGGCGHMHATYNSSRRRWNVYILMSILLLVFGCAIVGMMGIQRVKDRRLLNLLIKEKDGQILSLHLLLQTLSRVSSHNVPRLLGQQKERAQVQEVRKKTEEMKLKTYNLRAQNRQLNNKLLEMQLTISSLKKEQRTTELAFQKKQNEAKLLRERYIEIKDQNPQVKALTEILQQREAEIEDLKHHLQLPASTDEASTIPSNIMAKANISTTETPINVHESSTQSEEQREKGTGVEGISEITSNEKFDELENSKERSAGNGTTGVDERNEPVETKDNYDLQSGRRSETGQEKHEHETGMIKSLGTLEQKPRAKDSEETATTDDAHSRKISMSQGSDNQELGLHKVTLTGRYPYLRRAKGKRWRPIAKGQRLVERTEENGKKLEEAKPRNQGKIQDSIMGLRMQNESALKNQQFEVDDKLPDTKEDNGKSYIRVYNEENNGENSEEGPPGVMSKNRIEPVDTDKMSHTNSSSMRPHISQAEMPKYSTTNSEDSGLSRKAMIQYREEDGQSKERDIITEHTEIKTDNSPGQKDNDDDDETNEDSDNTQVQNFEETELGAIRSTKPAQNSEEDEEQTDETEF